MFRKYHYLNSDLISSAKCFIGMVEDKAITFCGVCHFPHGSVRNFKRVTRLVVLPDYQGAGIGGRFLDFIGRKYLKEEMRFIITTSNPALCWSFQKKPYWRLKAQGINSRHKGVVKTTSSARLTTSWEMITDGI